MTDLTRKRDFAEKKVVSVASAEVNYTEVDDTAQVLFNLPSDALDTDVYCVTKVAGQASLTVDVGVDGGAEFGNDLDIDNTGVTTDFRAGTGVYDTGTGTAVTATFSAAPTAGVFVFVVEYIEYTLGNGCLTNYTPV